MVFSARRINHFAEGDLHRLISRKLELLGILCLVLSGNLPSNPFPEASLFQWVVLRTPLFKPYFCYMVFFNKCIRGLSRFCPVIDQWRWASLDAYGSSPLHQHCRAVITWGFLLFYPWSSRITRSFLSCKLSPTGWWFVLMAWISYN